MEWLACCEYRDNDDFDCLFLHAGSMDWCITNHYVSGTRDYYSNYEKINSLAMFFGNESASHFLLERARLGKPSHAAPGVVHCVCWRCHHPHHVPSYTGPALPSMPINAEKSVIASP